jgi:DNA-binding CsgD family transcriptional regulator/tetratricopeptide (TPR) repeat protein
MQLLERTSFLQALAEYAGAARQGSGRLVFVSGESGIGKTVLLEAFQRDTKAARWLWGACDGLLTPRPLGPLFDIAAQVGGELAALCRREAPRDRLFAAFLAEIDSPATLTVAVLEDVHWADEATVDLLSFLGRRLGRMPALVIATYRDDEVGDDHPLRVALGDLATQRATRRIRLPPLSEEAVRALVGEADVDAGELYRLTGGNPFYVSEMVEAGWPSVPPTVRDVVRARLARLGAGTRRMVEAAAVMGARIDRPLLWSVLAGSGVSGDEHLAAGILVDDGTGQRFRHELVRLAVEAGIAPHRKTDLHGRLLTALEERADADPAALAHHAEGAGDREAVVRHASEAARRSSALGAHREAAAQLERALRYADGRDERTLAALHERAAGEYALLDRWQEAESALRTALRLRRGLCDELGVGEDLRLLSRALWRLCRGAEAARCIGESVRVLEALPAGRELAWAYASLGALSLEAGSLSEGLEAGGKARDIADRLRCADVMSNALNTIGCALCREGRDGLDTIEESLRIALDADLPEAVGRAYSNLQELAVCLNRFEDAERYYAAGIAYSEERELGVFAACLSGWRAYALLLQGRWDEAAGTCERMLARPGISPVNRLNPLRVLGTIRGRRSEPGAADLLDEALALAEGTGEVPWIVSARTARAELMWLAGEADLAVAEVMAAYDLALGVADRWTLGSLVIWLTRLRAPAGCPPGLPEPFALEIAGDWRGAATAWERLGRPYDAVLVRLVSPEGAGLRDALVALDSAGARAVATEGRRRMRELGVKAIPRGPRPATRSAPGGLTARELEVLALLSQGLRNQEISRRLVISERTVHRHVSAVLAKIGVSSRTAAAREAARMGIGAED